MRMSIRMEELPNENEMGFAFRKITFQQALQAVILVRHILGTYRRRQSRQPVGPGRHWSQLAGDDIRSTRELSRSQLPAPAVPVAST